MSDPNYIKNLGGAVARGAAIGAGGSFILSGGNPLVAATAGTLSAVGTVLVNTIETARDVKSIYKPAMRKKLSELK